MNTIPRPILIVAALVGILALVMFLRSYGALLLLVGGGLLLALVPIAALAGGGLLLLRTLRASQPAPAPPASPAPPAPAPLAQRLLAAFRRNQAAQLDQALAGLPAWPITPQIRATAHSLLALKRSVYRAQAEGVPAPLIARYLRNLEQAAATVWTVASTVDALGQQPVAYERLAVRLGQEERHLAQLQRAAQDAQEGIAQLLLLRMQRDALLQVEADLTALTGAIQQLAAAEAGVAVPAARR